MVARNIGAAKTWTSVISSHHLADLSAIRRSGLATGSWRQLSESQQSYTPRCSIRSLDAQMLFGANSRACSGKNAWLISTTGPNWERLEARCGSLLNYLLVITERFHGTSA